MTKYELDMEICSELVQRFQRLSDEIMKAQKHIMLNIDKNDKDYENKIEDCGNLIQSFHELGSVLIRKEFGTRKIETDLHFVCYNTEFKDPRY